MGFVSYGISGGARAAHDLRTICGALQMADVAAQVTLSTWTDFEEFRTFAPTARQAGALDAMLSQVIAWSGALAGLRGATSMVG